MPNEHDVIVIGAGHNGLVAANYLADAGLDVLVVEGHHKIGGMTTSGAEIPGAPDHIANHCAVDFLFWNMYPVAQELELHRYGLRTIEAQPSYAYLHPDGETSIAIWRDVKGTADEIRRFSRPDAEAFLELSRTMIPLFKLFRIATMAHPVHPGLGTIGRAVGIGARNVRELGNIAELMTSSGRDVIFDRFEHPATRAALYCLVAAQGSANYPMTAASLVFLGILQQSPCTRPIGGMQALPDALATRLQAKRGAVLTDARVAEILLKGGRARGVSLTDGRELLARRAVVASCDPQTALTRFLPAGTLEPTLEHRVRNLPTNAAGFGAMKVDVALSGRIDLSRYNRWRGDGVDMRLPTHLMGTPEEVERGYGRARAGLLPRGEEMQFWNCISTAADPTQAPDGQDSVYLYTTVAPVRPDEGWDALRDEFADTLVKRAADFYGNLGEMEIGRRISTPADLEERTGAPSGSFLHVDFTRMGPLRPARGLAGYRTPVDGLFLGSAGSHPFGTVTGMPGRLCAQEVLRKSGVLRFRRVRTFRYM